jgi:hypothetical protein
MKNICNNFPITDKEYFELNKKFGKLCYYAAHQLKKKNSRNNVAEDIEDINQELQMSIIRAGSYYKRQVYIEKCIKLSKIYVKNLFISKIVESLDNLWENKTKHGANRQKFGDYQEFILEKIIENYIPKENKPNKNDILKIDCKFSTYCKAIVWNGQKSMGKKITKEKNIRSGQCSLSEYDYLVTG